MSAFRAELCSLAQFRANLVAWLLYSPLRLGIVYLLWAIVYRSTDRVGEFSFADMIRYYLVVYCLRKVMEPAQTVNYQVWTDINQGNLDIYLARPLSFGLFTFFRSLATPAIEFLIGGVFLIAFTAALNLEVPGEPVVLSLFAGSVVCAYVILFLVQFLIGTLTFWIERIFGLRDAVFSVFLLFSGQLIPMSALPRGIREVSHFLPFEGIYYIPAMVFGATHAGEALAMLSVQVLWCILLLAAASMIWARGVSRYASQGG